MSMRDYEDMKDIVIPKEQEEMMNIICDAWEECLALKNCEECPDRPKKFMRMAMCNALKYTRKLIESGYTKRPTADVQEARIGMDREKQIEEVANILWHIPGSCFLNSYDDCARIAKHLYDDAGYCKKVEIAKDIFDDIESKLLNHVGDYYGCYHKTFDELKRKYTDCE